MSVIVGIHSLSDENIEKLLSDPMLWNVFEEANGEVSIIEGGSFTVPRDWFEIKHSTINQTNAVIDFVKRVLGKSTKPTFTETVTKVDYQEIVLVHGECRLTDTDTAWHKINYCLNELTEIHGLKENIFLESEQNIAFGEQKLSTYSSAEVVNILSQLDKVSQEAMRSVFSQEKMVKQDVYRSYIGEVEEDFEYVWEWYCEYIDFLKQCESHGLGMVVSC